MPAAAVAVFAVVVAASSVVTFNIAGGVESCRLELEACGSW